MNAGQIAEIRQRLAEVVEEELERRTEQTGQDWVHSNGGDRMRAVAERIANALRHGPDLDDPVVLIEDGMPCVLGYIKDHVVVAEERGGVRVSTLPLAELTTASLTPASGPPADIQTTVTFGRDLHVPVDTEAGAQWARRLALRQGLPAFM